MVGGGLKFEGACAWLKSKISLNAQQVYYGGTHYYSFIVQILMDIQFTY